MCQLADYFPALAGFRTASDEAWRHTAIAELLEEQDESPETPLRELRLPGFPGVRFLLKDESAHPSGSLKHRLARSLLLLALRDGRLGPGQALVDASSGSTAISEAWFARRLGLAFHAVLPRGTGAAKQAAIEAEGGRCVLVEPGEDLAFAARTLAQSVDACYLDQFGLAAKAGGACRDHGMAAEILAQHAALDTGGLAWVVCGAGTGGTSATLARRLGEASPATRVCVAEPTGAAFAEAWRRGDRSAVATRSTCIEGIGRPRVEPCFALDLVDAVAEVDDATSVAGAWCLERWTGRRYGGSSGTCLAAGLELGARMVERGERGAIVVVLGDRGDRYADTVFDAPWVARQGLGVLPWLRAMDRAARSGASTGLATLAAASSPACPAPVRCA